MVGIINLYPLLVEGVFGGLLITGIALTILLIILGMFTRQSPLLIICICFSFILAYGIGYVGAIVAIPAFVASFMYFVFALVDLFWRRVF